MKLRASQVETLQRIEKAGGEITAPRLAAVRSLIRPAEERLQRLVNQELLTPRLDGPSWDRRWVFCLTDKGRKALEGEQP